MTLVALLKLLDLAVTIQSNDWKYYFPTILWMIILVIWIGVTYKFGDWRNWRAYYSTILFFLCGNLIYNVVFKDNLLWQFENPFFSHVFTDLLDMTIVFPCTILLFFPYYPKAIVKKILYFSLWVFIYSIIELIFFNLKGIIYSFGWTFGWSVIHNIYQFLLIRIHHERPLIAWILAIAILLIVMSVFNVSIIVP